MRHVLTRLELYDMIWERAVSKVAPELGISDVALRKKCKKHAIPLTDATYWGRLHAGHSVKRKPLGAAPEGVNDLIAMTTHTANPDRKHVKVAIASTQQLVTESVASEKLHPLVARTLIAAKKAWPDRNGAITCTGGDVFRIRAHPDTLHRVGAFLKLLVYNAIACGHRFETDRGNIAMVVDSEMIGFTIHQSIRRKIHVATEEEKRRLEHWDARNRYNSDNWDKRPSIARYDFTPTGEMAIDIAGRSRSENARWRFTDTRTRKIESRIDEIMASFIASATGSKEQRENALSRAKLEDAARLQRGEKIQLANREKQRVEYLDRILVQADELDRLQKFL